VIFTATGNTTITQCLTENCVSPIPYLVYGTLTYPVPLTPAQPSPPSGYNAESCPSIGDGLWTVSNVSYQNYTKSQCKDWYNPEFDCIDLGFGWERKGVRLNLQVKNSAIDYEVTCSFTPTYGDYFPPNTLRCTGGDFNEITLDVTLTGSAPNFNFKIEELWYCLESPSTNVNP
jgi:hypothetical protein